MWPVLNESIPDGSRAVGCASSGCRCTKGGCCSRSSTVPTRTGSRGRHSFGSPRISELLGRLSRMRSAGFVTWARSSSTSPGAQDVRLGIGSVTSRRNLPACRAGWRRGTCLFHGAGWHRDTCPPVGHEGRTTHVRRSAVAMRALPGARRSLRSLCVIRMDSRITSTIGWLAGRCPSGEEAQREVTLGTREPHGRHVPACSRSCPLPRALAGYGEQEPGRVSSLADGHRGGRDLWGFPGRVKYARGVAT